MKEKWLGVVDLYGRYSQRILSIAGSAYLAVALLSYCLLFKQFSIGMERCGGGWVRSHSKSCIYHFFD